jgi:hypothetical protein
MSSSSQSRLASLYPDEIHPDETDTAELLVPRLLFFLYVLLLLHVSLLQLLRLLLVPLLHLLPLLLAGILVFQLLVFLLLLLLQVLPLLLLFRKEFVLLLLEFLVAVGIARVGLRHVFHRGKLAGVRERFPTATALSARSLASSISRRMIRAACFSGVHNIVTREFAGARSGCN